MRNMYVRIIVFSIVLILFMNGCSPSQKPFESNLSSETDTVKVNDNNKETINNLINEDENSIEKQIVGQLMGGFFYTSVTNDTKEKEFIELRKEAIEKFSDTINSAANNAFWVSDGFKKYEDVLFEYMDKIKLDSNGTIAVITKGILVNRTVVNSYRKQIETYRLTKFDDELMNATAKRYIFEAACELVKFQQRYLSWLMGSTDVIEAMLKESNNQSYQELINTCVDIYTNDIDVYFRNMIGNNFLSARIYTYILSADYHLNEYYINQIKQKIDVLTAFEKEKLKDTIQIYNNILKIDRKLPIIIGTISHDSTSKLNLLKKSLFSFPTIAYASDNYDEYLTNAMATTILREMLIQTLDSDSELDKTLEDILVEDVLLNEEFTDYIRQSYNRQMSIENDYNIRVRLLQSINTKENDEARNSRDVKIINEEIKSMESSAGITIDRQNIIDKITNAQMVLDGLEIIGTDSQYNMMISMINSLIEVKGNIDDEKIKNINNLINNDLKNILGDKKEELIDKITNTEAEQLISIFDDWKKNTVNFNELNFNREDLIRLVNSLGIEIKTDSTQVETFTNTNDTEVSSEMETNVSTEKIVRGFWEKIKTEEVIPSIYEIGDDKDSRKYTFEYSEGLINCSYIRLVYDGIKKTYLNETIETSGGWEITNDDGAYLPEQKVMITLSADINQFKRLTTVESGGSGTNLAGVAVWAYIGNVNTPFGNAMSGVLENNSGESVCRASITDGEITTPSSSLEVTSIFGPGKDKQQKVLFVVVSNQGRVGGIKYTYQYAE